MSGRGDERGFVLVVTALMATAFALLAALVVDLGQVRSDRRTNKATADVAARAGIARLPFGPWAGVCQARRYLLRNAKGFSSFDPGSETWSNVASSTTPATVYPSSPCPSDPLAPTAACVPNDPLTWARLQATAGGGRFTVEIQGGYAMPDPRFAEDTGRGDVGDPARGGCDNLSIIISQNRQMLFGRVGGFASGTSRIRSVGRLNAIETIDFVAALQLLERTNCTVLQTGGSGTRVVSHPFETYPGTIQIDSDGSACSSNSYLIAGQANGTASDPRPSVLACSTNPTNPDCQVGTGTRRSRIGAYALNFKPPSIAGQFPSHYGDTEAIASPRTGRKFADRRYRGNVDALDEEVKSVLTGNSGRPPGCASVTDNTCTGNGLTWLVLQQADCNDLAAFFLVPGRSSQQNIWFNCDLSVGTPLTLTAANSYVAVTGRLAVASTFTITDPRKVYIYGQPSSNRIGVDVGGGAFAVNPGLSATCSLRSGAGGTTTRLVVGHGTFKVASGASVQMCQTFVLLASGFDKVPATDGTAPCKTTACTNYGGTINISSNSSVDWSAPNEITDRLPDATELATTHKFEDLALWTEAGGNGNTITGGGTTTMAGSFFMPNADSFNLAGNGSLPVYLSAQFIATTMKVTGNGLVHLVPNPLDSIPTSIYNTLLVR